MSIPAGSLDKRVRIEEPTVSKDTSGGMVKDWALHMPMWARIRHISGNKARITRAAGGEVAGNTTEITVRYRPTITARMRVVHGSTVYKILRADNVDERGEYLLLTCEAGGTNG